MPFLPIHTFSPPTQSPLQNYSTEYSCKTLRNAFLSFNPSLLPLFFPSSLAKKSKECRFDQTRHRQNQHNRMQLRKTKKMLLFFQSFLPSVRPSFLPRLLSTKKCTECRFYPATLRQNRLIHLYKHQMEQSTDSGKVFFLSHLRKLRMIAVSTTVITLPFRHPIHCASLRCSVTLRLRPYP